MTVNKMEFIEFMIKSGVLKFGDFILKSGRASPYFINTGNYKTGAQIRVLGEYYASKVFAVVGDRFDAMFGPAYKGITLVTATAIALFEKFGVDKPFCFNRKEIKDHGEKGSVVGYAPSSKDRIIIIEDVITAGTAIRETEKFLHRIDAGIELTDMFISFDRCEKGTGNATAIDEIHERLGINVHALADVRDLCDYLAAIGGYEEVLGKMHTYIDDYCVSKPV